MRSKDNRGIKASMESEEFLLRFDSDSDEFARGFACGEIWACLCDEVPEIHCVTTVDNTEMVMRMAEASGYSFEARDLTQQELNLIAEDDDVNDWLVVILRIEHG